MTTLRVDPDDMTIGDLEDFQDLTGETIERAFSPKYVLDENGEKTYDDKGRPLKDVYVGPKVLKALIFLSERRANPDFTLDDARKVKVSDLEIVSAEPDPTTQTD
jgi:hypothetical protein